MIKHLVIATTLIARLAHADDPPASPPSADPAQPTAPPVETPPPSPPPPVEPPPAVPVETPPPAPPTPPAVVVEVKKPAEPPAHKDDYYSREHGYGIFHDSRFVVGGLAADAPEVVDGMTTGAIKGTTMLSIALEGAYLALPSSFGNFHGIEFSTGLRGQPLDFWMSFGTAVSLLNVGEGGPGSFRIGGAFGAGFNLAHGYGYVKARAAIVLIPSMLDAEASVQWTPAAASTGNYDEREIRISVWYRPGASKRAYEVYVQMLRRDDDQAVLERELDGIGGGIGMTLF